MNPYDSPEQPSQEPQKTSGMAVASLVLGICSFVFSILAGIPAIILGIIALTKISSNKPHVGGAGLAIAGITTGAVGSLMIGGCIALLLPAVQAAREAARSNQTLGQMKQMALAAHNHESTHKRFPLAGVDENGVGPQLSWRVHLLPYLEHQQLYSQFHLDEPWDSPHNKPLIDQMPAVYMSPSGGPIPPGHTMFQAVTGPQCWGRGGVQGPTFPDFTDGTSSTILFVEVDEEYAVPWTKPDDYQLAPNDPQKGLGGVHSRHWIAAMADGSVRRISSTSDDATVRSMMTSDAGD